MLLSACNLICIHVKALISRATEDLGRNQRLLILLSRERVADPEPEATYLECLSCVVSCTRGLTIKVVPFFIFLIVTCIHQCSVFFVVFFFGRATFGISGI